MLYMLIEILISAIILMPVFIALNQLRFHNTGRTVLYFAFAIYLSAVYLFVGLPTLQFMEFELSLTLIPFVPMLADLKNTVLNVILFAPLGVMLPFLWKKYGTLKSTMLFGFGMSLAIELLQILTYRATDVNDVITNTLGVAVGYEIYRLISKLIPSLRKNARGRNDVFIILVSVYLVMFFIQPCLATLFYKIT